MMSSSKKGTSYFGCLLYYVPDIKSNFLSIGQWREDMTSRSVIYLALSLLDKKSKQADYSCEDDEEQDVTVETFHYGVEVHEGNHSRS